jgi:hypothetical protein
MRRYTRYVRWGAEGFTLVIILLLGLLNLALYGGFLVGEEPVSRGSSATLPEGNAPGVDSWQAAESDASPALPGAYVAPQGRSHIPDWQSGVEIPFCEGGEVSDGCYASNPPTSGQHIGVISGVKLDGGQTVNIPPDPGVYAYAFPKEAIPHIEEHAGVFVGYNCESSLCDDVVAEVRALVEEQLDLGARVVMAPYPDLTSERIGLASWTRYQVFTPAEYSEGDVRRFIETHSCRVDYENLCG